MRTLIAIAVLTLITSPAAAQQSGGGADEAQMRELFNRATTYFNLGRFAEAAGGNPGPVQPPPNFGYTMPGSVDLISAPGRTPAVATTIANPISGDTGFGQLIVPGSTDFNGDGKPDVLVAASNHLFIVYGR